MRTASFLCISIALHAAALAYPALHSAPEKAPPIAVTVVEADGGGGNSSAEEKAEGASAAHSTAPKQMKRASAQNAKPPRVTESNALAETPTIAAPGEAVAPPIVETQTQSVSVVPVRETVVAVALESGAAASGGISFSSKGVGGSGSSAAGSGPGAGNGSGAGSGSGSGGGVGGGTGNAAGAGRFVQASYMSCPRTDYPEAARRQGLEGTVTIEVAVDEDGRPQSSRVQQSSGFAVLDSAALDNIQRRCRFYPARRGEMRVATSIRIPVVFRLADSR